MNLEELLVGGGGGFLLLLTLIQISPLKVNPWSAIGRGLKKGVASLGRLLNADVLEKLNQVETAQKETKEKLETHIDQDDQREADRVRAAILKFNNELLRDIPHTKEEFIDILAKKDAYEDYCDTHPHYKNSRAVHAIANIERVYDERLQKHDFLADAEERKKHYE